MTNLIVNWSSYLARVTTMLLGSWCVATIADVLISRTYLFGITGMLKTRCRSRAQKHTIRLHQFHGDSEFVTWLSRIVTNQCLMFMRVRRRARFVYLDDASPESEAPPLELAAGGPDPEGELAVNELKQVLRTEIRHIPPLLRKLVSATRYRRVAHGRCSRGTSDQRPGCEVPTPARAERTRDSAKAKVSEYWDSVAAVQICRAA